MFLQLIFSVDPTFSHATIGRLCIKPACYWSIVLFTLSKDDNNKKTKPKPQHFRQFRKSQPGHIQEKQDIWSPGAVIITVWNQYFNSLFLKTASVWNMPSNPKIPALSISVWSGATDIPLTLKGEADYIDHMFYVFGSLGPAGELVHKGKSMKIRPPRAQLRGNSFTVAWTGSIQEAKQQFTPLHSKQVHRQMFHGPYILHLLY